MEAAWVGVTVGVSSYSMNEEWSIRVIKELRIKRMKSIRNSIKTKG